MKKKKNFVASNDVRTLNVFTVLVQGQKQRSVLASAIE